MTYRLILTASAALLAPLVVRAQPIVGPLQTQNNLGEIAANGTQNTARTNIAACGVGTTCPNLNIQNAMTLSSTSYSGGLPKTTATSIFVNNGSITGTNNDTFLVPYNWIGVSNDTATLNTGGGVGLVVYDNFGGGTTTKGGRGAIYGVLRQVGGTLNNGPVTGNYPAYIGISGEASSNSNDNGTGTTSTTSSGQITGTLTNGELLAGATDYYAVQSMEANVKIQTGASAYLKTGVQITQFSDDAVQGAVEDAALLINNQPSAVGWKYGIQFGTTQFPHMVASGGTLIGSKSTDTVTNLVDFSTISCSGAAWQSPAYSVGCGGTVTVGGTATSAPTVNIDGASGTLREIVFQSAGLSRWSIGAGSGAETGSNAGSDFYFQRYNDAGSPVDVPLVVQRQSGVVEFKNTVAESNYSLCSVTTGGTCTFAANQMISFHNAGASQATITVKLPPSPVNGQVADYFEVWGVSGTFTIEDSGGTAANVLFRQTTLPAGAWVHCIWGGVYPIWVCGH